MRPAVVVGLTLGVGTVGCTQALEPDHLCREVGYAIAGRTVQCTGESSLAEARFDALLAGYTCRPVSGESFGEDTAGRVAPQELFHCPLAIRNLPCEKVDEYGDDLDRWLEASPACAWIFTASTAAEAADLDLGEGW